ncbi:MAG: 5-formyltetrahydrofolate cyclo-ligase [Nitrospirae bacterium]|nr:5-formyltetrahydrofolate cyclo-ligase [Nitrospirota bacterium]
MIEKSLIRKLILRRRDTISAQDKKAKDIEIRNRLLTLKEFKSAKKVMFYASFRSEPETLTIIEEAIGLGKLIALPKVDMKEHRLDVYEIWSVDELASGCMNIPEPGVSESRRVTLHELGHFDLIITPGAAFDASGGRLGYGGGFYDRLLSSMKNRPLLVALAYVEQLVDSIPMQPHDIRIDKIITDVGIIDAKNHIAIPLIKAVTTV